MRGSIALVLALAACRAPSSGGPADVVAPPPVAPAQSVHLPVSRPALRDHPLVASLAPHLVSSAGGPSCAVALDANYLYFTARDSVRKVPIAGGPEETVADHQGEPTAIAVDTGRIYWTVRGANRVRQAAIDGGGWGGLAADEDTPLDITIDDDFVYWVNAGFDESPSGDAVMKRAKGGGELLVVSREAKGAKPRSIAVDADAVYWVDENDSNGGTIRRTAKAGGPPATLASGQVSPHAIALDDAFVYWTNSALGADGSVARVAKGGGAVRTIAPQTAGAAAPNGIALDTTSVYFTDSWGGVHRVSKGGGNSTKLADIPGGGGTARSIAVGDASLWVCGDAGLWKLSWGGATGAR